METTLNTFWRASIVLSLVLFTACTTKPTRVQENPARRTDTVPGADKPIEITPETVVVDARPRFDYSVAHIPKAISLQWSDFTEPEPAQRGILQRDLFAATRRLARAGIDPNTHVVVVGRGLAGQGEEGRVAWMLRYLGVTNVQFASLESLKPRLTNLSEETPLAEKPMWKPNSVESLHVTRTELLNAINKQGTTRPLVSPVSASPVLYRIIDVRSERAYLGKEGLGASRKVPNMGAINIPWREFFEPSMKPQEELAVRLRQVGIDPSHRIIVVDEDGVSSAAVALALRMLGFEKAGNYSGGLQDLLSAYGQ